MKNPIPHEDILRVSAAVDPPPKRRRKLFAVLPTLLTLGNAACGFGAIILATKIGTPAATGNELWIAAVLIYAAMVFDMFDGAAARKLNQTSEFGAHLDSLCDAVSFGVAPAVLMLQLVLVTHDARTETRSRPLVRVFAPNSLHDRRDVRGVCVVAPRTIQC